jgi:3-oxoadipate enol-lactonase
MAASRTRYAHRDGLRIAYEIRRARWRRPPWMVLIQGLGFDRSGWDPVVDRLGDHFALLLVDNRGSGSSDPPAGRLSVGDLAEDVLAVLDVAGVGGAHVVGASLGGMVAQHLAVEHADRVDTLVLACTTPGWPFGYPMPPASIALLAATGQLPADVAMRRHVENALSPDTVHNRPELVERLITHQQRHSRDSAGWLAQVSAGARFGGLRQNAITARTLVMHGTADQVVDPRNARLLADRIPDAQLMLLPRLGHLFFWEAPGVFTDAVTRFALTSPPITVSPSSPRKDEP